MVEFDVHGEGDDFVRFEVAVFEGAANVFLGPALQKTRMGAPFVLLALGAAPKSLLAQGALLTQVQLNTRFCLHYSNNPKF